MLSSYYPKAWHPDDAPFFQDLFHEDLTITESAKDARRERGKIIRRIHDLIIQNRNPFAAIGFEQSGMISVEPALGAAEIVGRCGGNSSDARAFLNDVEINKPFREFSPHPLVQGFIVFVGINYLTVQYRDPFAAMRFQGFAAVSLKPAIALPEFRCASGEFEIFEARRRSGSALCGALHLFVPVS
jgi:hypothetical protein